MVIGRQNFGWKITNILVKYLYCWWYHLHIRDHNHCMWNCWFRLCSYLHLNMDWNHIHRCQSHRCHLLEDEMHIKLKKFLSLDPRVTKITEIYYLHQERPTAFVSSKLHWLIFHDFFPWSPFKFTSLRHMPKQRLQLKFLAVARLHTSTTACKLGIAYGSVS